MKHFYCTPEQGPRNVEKIVMPKIQAAGAPFVLSAVMFAVSHVAFAPDSDAHALDVCSSRSSR